MKRLGWMGVAAWLASTGCTPAPQSVASNVPSDATNPTLVASAAPASSSPATSSVDIATATPTPSASSSPDAARDARIHEKFGRVCRLERACGALWGIDCEAASDGPYYYVKAETLETVSECGGFCRGGRCTNCPPKEWSCATY